MTTHINDRVHLCPSICRHKLCSLNHHHASTDVYDPSKRQRGMQHGPIHTVWPICRLLQDGVDSKSPVPLKRPPLKPQQRSTGLVRRIIGQSRRHNYGTNNQHNERPPRALTNIRIVSSHHKRYIIMLSRRRQNFLVMIPPLLPNCLTHAPFTYLQT